MSSKEYTKRFIKPKNTSGSNPLFFQPKLSINNPYDKYEQEADAVADKIMGMETASLQKKEINNSFFKASPISITPVQRKCAHCEEEEEEKMQRKEMNDGETTVDNNLESYDGSLNSRGESLPNEVRNFYEPRFGYDFSNVKVHTDNVAAKSAQSINALAYTSGSNIVFNNGQYSPNTDSGKRLLSHELTHVVQQNQSVQPKLIQRSWLGAGIGALGGALLGGLIGGAIGGWPGALIGGLGGLIVGGIIGGLASRNTRRNCQPEERRDFWITVYYRREPDGVTRNKVRDEVNEATDVLQDCCLNLQAEYRMNRIPGPGVFNYGTTRPDGNIDYSADAENLGNRSFEGSRGIPVLIVDDVPGSGGGVTVIPSADPQYHGRTYAVVAVNQPSQHDNSRCNTLVHELWHVAGNLNHNADQGGGIAACTANELSPRYCSNLRSLVRGAGLPLGDFPMPSNTSEKAG